MHSEDLLANECQQRDKIKDKYATNYTAGKTKALAVDWSCGVEKLMQMNTQK